MAAAMTGGKIHKPVDDFDAPHEAPLEKREEEILTLSIDGFEGPLDLLLALSRTRKIDLTQLSMAALAQQYIAYIEEMRSKRLEIAADYLVMAAWLAFLKSKLMLPGEAEAGDEPSGDELAARLAFRLKRLAAMRERAEMLMARDQLGQDYFARGWEEPVETIARVSYKPDYFGLLQAYAMQRQRVSETRFKVKRREVWSIKKARQRLQTLLGMPLDWAPINDLIAAFLGEEALKKTTVASTFGASLEMARDGLVELKQTAPFSPLYIKTVGEGVETNSQGADEGAVTPQREGDDE